MKTTLQIPVLAAVALLAVINISAVQNSVPSDTSHATDGGEAYVNQRLSALEAQVFGNGRWVALGSDGKLRLSTDRSRWNSASLPVESFLREMAFVNGQFVAVGGSYLSGGSVVLTSLNGRSWNLHTCS